MDRLIEGGDDIEVLVGQLEGEADLFEAIQGRFTQACLEVGIGVTTKDATAGKTDRVDGAFASDVVGAPVFGSGLTAVGSNVFGEEGQLGCGDIKAVVEALKVAAPAASAAGACPAGVAALLCLDPPVQGCYRAAEILDSLVLSHQFLFFLICSIWSKL